MTRHYEKDAVDRRESIYWSWDHKQVTVSVSLSWLQLSVVPHAETDQSTLQLH